MSFPVNILKETNANTNPTDIVLVMLLSRDFDGIDVMYLLLAGTILGEPGLPKDVKLCLQMPPIRNACVIVYLPSPFWPSNQEK